MEVPSPVFCLLISFCIGIVQNDNAMASKSKTIQGNVIFQLESNDNFRSPNTTSVSTATFIY